MNRAAFVALVAVMSGCSVGFGDLSGSHGKPGPPVNVPTQTSTTLGALVTGFNESGDCVYRPFVKVGDAEDNRDDGHAQIEGYSPGSVARSRDGQVITEKVDASRFMRMGELRMFGAHTCKAPFYQ